MSVSGALSHALHMYSWQCMPALSHMLQSKCVLVKYTVKYLISMLSLHNSWALNGLSAKQLSLAFGLNSMQSRLPKS